MAITYSPQKDQEYANFKKNGGTIVFEIDAEDISVSKDFENFDSIKPKLNTGFELPPTTLIESPELQALIATSGSVWDFIFTRVYLAGGNVVYKKQGNGKYQAECTVPAK